MAKTLAVVPPDGVPTPPRALGKSGLALWRAVMSEFMISDSGGVELLLQACATADRIEELAECIARDGVAIRTKTGIKENPLLKHELAARSFLTRTLARLGVTVEPLKSVGRPPPGGWSPVT